MVFVRRLKLMVLRIPRVDGLGPRDTALISCIKCSSKFMRSASIRPKMKRRMITGLCAGLGDTHGGVVGAKNDCVCEVFLLLMEKRAFRFLVSVSYFAGRRWRRDWDGFVRGRQLGWYWRWCLILLDCIASRRRWESINATPAPRLK